MGGRGARVGWGGGDGWRPRRGWWWLWWRRRRRRRRRGRRKGCGPCGWDEANYAGPPCGVRVLADTGGVKVFRRRYRGGQRLGYRRGAGSASRAGGGLRRRE